ncbi:MAG: hypothetical protein R3346_04915 [Candidatus Spechtbacterales bacterium]|nr:hypothetical protein [Candidatus Spechtbacterales bacterium]
MEGPEKFNTGSKKTNDEIAKELLEFLEDTESGKSMKEKPEPSPEQLKENPAEEAGSYRIAWENPSTGASGKGPYSESKKTGEARVKRQNKNYPYMKFWLEKKPEE